MFHQAENFLFGRNGTVKDQHKAVEYLTICVQQSLPIAMSVLGFCREFGLGCEMDFIEAERLYISAANHEDGLGQARLAFLRKYGRPGVKIDRVEADEWQAKATAIGPSSIEWLMRAADEDCDPSAQYALGVCYHDGVAVQKNPHEAIKYYKLSAEQGHPRGQGILGYCHGEGFGLEKDEQAAMFYYRLAAAQGESVAIYNIGFCFEDGVGVPRDEQEAVRYYRISAEQGNAFAQNSLGYWYAFYSYL